MTQLATVVLALETTDVAEEVMQFLDRSGQARVVATADDDRQLVAAVRQLSPDAVVAQPAMVGSGVPSGATILALDVRESVTSLRRAIRIGAAGYFVWPGDRDQLGAAVAATVVAPVLDERRGLVVAVHGARGGVGTTFVATHLAAALARRGSCTLLDADLLYGDVSAVIGMPQDGLHTFTDLAMLADELAPGHLQEALWSHPQGFGVLAGPAPEQAEHAGAEAFGRVVDTAALCTDAVVVHLPRALDPYARAVLLAADRIIEVLSLDVLSFRATTRMLEAFDPLQVGTTVGFLVNRSRSGEITAGDVARVFGAEPLAVLPVDRSVSRAQDHGRLLPPKGRMARAFDRLAACVCEGPDVDGRSGSGSSPVVTPIASGPPADA